MRIKNKAVLDKIKNMDENCRNNNILNDSIDLDKNDDINIINSNNNIVRAESFTLNPNLKLLKCFDNDDNKIPKEDDNKNKLNASFCEDLSALVGYSKNNIGPQHTNSIFLLNNSLILNEPFIPNNDNTFLKNNMTNSFMQKTI